MTTPNATALLDRLSALGWTVALAESLTGGLLASTLIEVPGASKTVRGGVVAYATDLKQSVLGVDGALLAAHGPVHPDVARQMAEGVRGRLDADVGISTTGVAGPDPQGGQPVGTVHIAIATPDGTTVGSYSFGGNVTVRRECHAWNSPQMPETGTVQSGGVRADASGPSFRV